MFKNDMWVVILAGGFGTRLPEYTKRMPKPMIKISNKPILLRIIDHYKKHGFSKFIIATGYKSKFIKNYFTKGYRNTHIETIFTGLNTMTGGRIKRLKNKLKNQTFLLTYGDGLSNVDINKLLKFHQKNRGYVTLTAVRPPARFGAIKIRGNKVSYFKEKSSLDEGWINGGFFVFEPEIFKFIASDKTFLEKEPLEKIGKLGKLFAFKHNGFWQCMDTKRDKEILEKKFKK